MSAETDLKAILPAMDPELRFGACVFVSVPHGEAKPEVDILASVHEPEGWSLVLRRDDADAAGLAYDYVAAWITLRVYSSLAAVGLTAAVSTALAEAGISCNVIAGHHHDHLLVPHDEAERALRILRRLSS
jgi:hypothetical protein